jgi:hypothetical protein
MAKLESVSWQGKSGKTHSGYVGEFSQGGWGTSNCGIYVFCKKTESGWTAVYIGETDSFIELAARLSKHPRWKCIEKEGATHVCTLLISGGTREKQPRLDALADLVARYQPPCNQE